MAFESRFTSTDDAPTRRETTCGLSCHFIESFVPGLRLGRRSGASQGAGRPLGVRWGTSVPRPIHLQGGAGPGPRYRPITTLVSMRYVVEREGPPWVQPLAWTALAVGIAGAVGPEPQRLPLISPTFTHAP